MENEGLEKNGNFWHLDLLLFSLLPVLCLFAASLSLLGCFWCGLRVPVGNGRIPKIIEKSMENNPFVPAMLYRFECLLGASEILLGCLFAASWVHCWVPFECLLID